MTKKLLEVLSNVPTEKIIFTRGNLAVEVTAPVVESSQELQPGGVFVARTGQTADGHRYIPQAIAGGAVGIVGEAPFERLRAEFGLDAATAYLRVRDAQALIGPLAAAYHDFPSRKLVLIGVTGTDGKTTTCHLLHSILQRASGMRCGYISTISADFGDQALATGLHVTTPGAPRVQAYLARMAAAGLTHCVLEMTSHGLAQGRLNGVDIDVAALTNVMHEHLDFHGTWQNYRAAKAIMFKMLGKSWRKSGVPKLSVVNADDESADYFGGFAADRARSYGMRASADYQATDLRFQPGATDFRVRGQDLTMRLLGEFNVSNALAAIAVARELGISWAHIRAGLAAVDLIAGRMQPIYAGQDFLALVDFAHSPNALRRALQAGRAMLPPGKRLIAVFGSAGLRDVEKRHLMAKTSAQLADMTILTAEDPRTESLDDILEQMAAGCRAAGAVEGESFMRLPDRGEAILRACQLARAGDLVMACGKGHEQSMCFGETEYPWDDREAMRSALRGTPLATLPTVGASG